MWRAGKHHMDQREHSQCFTSLICCKCVLVCKWLRSVSQLDWMFYWTPALAETHFTHLNLCLQTLNLEKSCQNIKSALRFEHLCSELTQHGAHARHWGCSSINIKLGKINCPEARTVNLYTLSPISLKVEVLNQIKPGRCTMELCTKWYSYVKPQPLKNTVKAGKLSSLFIPPTWSCLPAAAAIDIKSDSLCWDSDQDGDRHRACTDDVCRQRGRAPTLCSTTYPLSVEMPCCCSCCWLSGVHGI